MAAGCSNKVAANQLNVTEETVKDHMKSILSAFALQNETDAQISVAVTEEARSLRAAVRDELYLDRA